MGSRFGRLMGYSNYKQPILIISVLTVIYFIIVFWFSPLDWPIYGDAAAYEEMATGVAVDAPFSYRVIIPWIVSLFPQPLHKLVFLIHTSLNLLISSIILFAYLYVKKVDLEYCYLGIFIWMGSLAFQYHLLNFGLVDPSFLTIIVSSLLLLELGYEFAAVPVLLVGFFVKESALFLFPLVVLETLYKRKWIPFAAALGSSIILGLITFLRLVSHDSMSVLEVFAYNGIPLDAGLPIAVIDYVVTIGLYAFGVYGVIIVSAVIGFLFLERVDKLRILWLTLAFVIMTLLATDWSRMMFLLYPIVIYAGILPLISGNFLISKTIDKIIIWSLVLSLLIIGPAIWILNLDGILILKIIFGIVVGLIALLYSKNRLASIAWRFSQKMQKDTMNQDYVSES